MYQIGIIGFGFVGKAVYSSYSPYSSIDPKYIIDPFIDTAKGTYKDIQNTDAVYVCVSSPQNADGTCNTINLEDVLHKLKSINYQGVIISKVTAPPDFYRKKQEEHQNLVYVPEFLTASNHISDYLNSRFHVIGGKNKAYCLLAKDVLKEVFGNDINYYFSTIEEASMMKYTINCFLATKVIFMNEIKELCDKVNVDYGNVKKLLELDNKRIGNSHTLVPGPDGLLGFGGACFPKDTSAFLKFAETQSADMTLLRSAIEKNNIIR
jgi:UDPglucose 6-dehydrogenase